MWLEKSGISLTITDDNNIFMIIIYEPRGLCGEGKGNIY